MGFALTARFAAVERGNPEQDQILILDAEASLSPNLLFEAAALHASYNQRGSEAAELVCHGIHHRRICDIATFIACLYNLPSWLREHPEVKLIVIDSLSSHLRPTSHSHQTKQLIANVLKSTLSTITLEHKVSVILTSYVSIKLFNQLGSPANFSDPTAEALLLPQLREDQFLPNSKVSIWRIVLYFDQKGERLAHLISGSGQSKATSAAFTMDALGPCDYPPQESEVI